MLCGWQQAGVPPVCRLLLPLLIKEYTQELLHKSEITLWNGRYFFASKRRMKCAGNTIAVWWEIVYTEKEKKCYKSLGGTKFMRQIKRARKRERVKKKLISIVVLCLLSVILFSTAAASEKSGLAVISVKAKSETMYQDSELPKFSVDIHGEGAMKTTLDEKEQYTAQQFMESLTEGKDYTLECESDGTKEGTFPVKIKLSDDLQKKLEGELSQSVFF